MRETERPNRPVGGLRRWLHNNNYQDAEGGEVYAIEFTVEDIDYLDSRAESEARRSRNAQSRQPATA
jgi:hypothetical protein